MGRGVAFEARSQLVGIANDSQRQPRQLFELGGKLETVVGGDRLGHPLHKTAGE